MPDPRALLDAYADESCTHIAVDDHSGGYEREEFAPKAFDALWSVLNLADNWTGGKCLVGYRVTDGDDTDSECLHCASEALRRAITTALQGEDHA